MPFKKPLVYLPINATATSETLRFACGLADHPGAQLTVIDVVPEAPWYEATDDRAIVDRESEERVSRIEGLLGQTCGQVAHFVEVRHGKAFQEIVRKVHEDGHDLLIKVGVAPAPSDSWFGSLARHLLRKCPCPVWLIKPDAARPPKHIAVAIDPAPDDDERNALAQRLVSTALELAAAYDCRVSIIHCWEVYGEAWLAARKSVDVLFSHIEATERRVRIFVESFLKPFARMIGERDIHLIQGNADEGIPAFVASNEVDLLVMGTMGRSGLTGMLIGNTAEQVLDTVQCSVLVLKPEGPVDSVT